MTKKHLPFFAIALIFLSGCMSASVKDIKISSEAAPKANFNGYSTYAWLGSAMVLNDPAGQWEPNGFDADAEIKYLIDRELRNRGMSEDSNAPDLLAVFAAGVDMESLELKTDPKTKTDIMKEIPQGGLLIAFLDSDTGFIIWIGVASGDIQTETSEKLVKQRLDYAVKKLIKKMPK